jgi:hypothetical protein
MKIAPIRNSLPLAFCVVFSLTACTSPSASSFSPSLSGAGSGAAARFAVAKFTQYNVPTASSEPYKIALGPSGNALFFTEFAGNKIGQITTAGKCTQLQSRPASR